MSPDWSNVTYSRKFLLSYFNHRMRNILLRNKNFLPFFHLLVIYIKTASNKCDEFVTFKNNWKYSSTKCLAKFHPKFSRPESNVTSFNVHTKMNGRDATRRYKLPRYPILFTGRSNRILAFRTRTLTCSSRQSGLHRRWTDHLALSSVGRVLGPRRRSDRAVTRSKRNP